MRRLPLLLILAGCPRKVPEHLQLHPSADDTVATVEITDTASAIAAIVGKDPLARSPSLPDPAGLEPLEGGEPLAAFARGIRSIEQGEGPIERVLQQLEDEWRNTAVVALARGYRLRIAENELVALETEEAQQAVLGLVTPLSGGAADATLPRRPLQWLGEGPEPVRAYAERWVLTGWLASPEIPLQPLTGPITQPQYDDIRETPVGRLLVARASGASADATRGLADLERATRLALTRAAADRDAEQAAWSDEKKAAAAELGDTDPIAKLLERASEDLTAAAGDDKAAGGALLAIGALRWVDRCPPEQPCAGVDRVETMSFASRWDADVARLAAVWRVVALKEALDTLEVGRDTALFSEAVVDVVDALLGTGAGPLEARLLQKRSPDPAVWLTLSRAVGTEGVTDWEGTRVAIGKHLEREAGQARALAADEAMAALLDRVASRAVP